MEFRTIIILFIAGTVAGVMNTVGGGGSILTLPAMILLGGIPAAAANATNRIGIFVQNMVALNRFRKGGVKEDYLASYLVLPALGGSIIGAIAAAYISSESFQKILAVVMLLLLIPLIFKPKALEVAAGSESRVWHNATPARRRAAQFAFFALGIYMGFLQAGAGIMILALLGHFFRLNLVRSNYVKLLLVLLVNLLAFAIFLMKGVEIYWTAGIALLVGQTLGASIGSWIALKKGDKWILVLLVVCILLSSYKLLFGG